YDRALRTGFDPADNAYLKYRAIMPRVDNLDAQTPEVLQFEGFRSANPPAFGFPQPWNPEQHLDWERSYQRTRDTLRMFRDGSRLPRVAFPMKFIRYFGPQEKALGPEPHILYDLRLT